MKNGLTRWFALWHPRYRVFLVQLGLAGIGAAVLEFAQNRLLQLITQALAQPASADHDASDALPSWLAFHSAGSADSGWRVAFICLAIFVVVKGIDAVVGYWKARVSGRLKVTSEDDMESEILSHLLRKDEAFFSRHSPAETVSRLAVDVYRVSDRRPLIMNLWWSVLLIVGNLAFFVMKDWWMALLALAGCLAGAVWTQRMTRHVKQMDSDYMRQDDTVKSRFEDFLRASAEVQVGRLHSWVRNRLGEVQEPRTRTYMKYVRLSAALNVGSVVAYLLTFVSMIVVIRLRASGSGGEAWTLVPVVIWAMPTLFGSASLIIMHNVQLQLANTSIKRLLEYEAQEMAAGSGDQHASTGWSQTKTSSEVPISPGGAPGFQTQNATYRYSTPEGPTQGGVADVTTEFKPGKWTAIVGGAGSGKSTLVRLLLGRVKPQAGSVLYGQEPVEELASGSLSEVVSFMPQSPALLNATILENILLGRDTPRAGGHGTGPSLAPEELDLLERIGLGRICRIKAIDMTPQAGGSLSSLSDTVAEIRNRTRQWLASRCQAEILPYESGYSDAKHWILECLLEGRCDRGRAIESLLKGHGLRKLPSILPTGLASQLTKAGQTLLHQSRQLLSIPNYHVYAQLAVFPLPELLWELRSSNVHLGQAQALTPRETAILCAIALTCSPAELAGDERAEDWCSPQARKALGTDTRRLRDALGDICVPFDVQRIHPHLTWRENLLFGVLDTHNSHAKQVLDQSLVEFIEQDSPSSFIAAERTPAGSCQNHPLKDMITDAGLQSDVGRLGGNLSGGQGQLVALCRTILRRTVVMILDEPTSALDPVSRTRVAQFLRHPGEDRVIITVSHDPEFIRQADEVKVIDNGRLVASGTFEQLKEGSELFRRILGQR